MIFQKLHDKLYDKMAANNDKWLQSMPLHERDQVEEAAKSNWGAIRWKFTQHRRR